MILRISPPRKSLGLGVTLLQQRGGAYFDKCLPPGSPALGSLQGSLKALQGSLKAGYGQVWSRWGRGRLYLDKFFSCVFVFCDTGRELGLAREKDVFIIYQVSNLDLCRNSPGRPISPGRCLTSLRPLPPTRQPITRPTGCAPAT